MTNQRICVPVSHLWPSRRHTGSNMWNRFGQRWLLRTYMSCSYVQVTTPFSAIFFVLFFVPLPMGRETRHGRVRMSSDTDWLNPCRLSIKQCWCWSFLFWIPIIFPRQSTEFKKIMIPIPGRMNTYNYIVYTMIFLWFGYWLQSLNPQCTEIPRIDEILSHCQPWSVGFNKQSWGHCESDCAQHSHCSLMFVWDTKMPLVYWKVSGVQRL